MDISNYGKAKEWYEKAAELGNGEALMRLGDLYYQGLGVNIDYQLALDYYKKSIEHGCSKAEDKLKSIQAILEKQKINKDKQAEKKYWLISGLILFILFILFLFYIIVSCTNHAEVTTTLETNINETIAKERKNNISIKPDSKANVKSIDLVDIGLPVKVHARSVSNKYIRASLGDEYYKANNFSEALKYYNEAALKGNSYSMVEIGKMYEEGKGVKKDIKEAEKWYQMAADCTNKYGYYYLGKLYDDVSNKKLDYKKAFECYQKAVLLGCREAHLSFGQLYEYGRYVGRDYYKAEAEYQKALDFNREDTNAKKRLALVLIKIGDASVAKNGVSYASTYYNRASKYLKELAEKNDSEALYELGRVYEYGKGVRADKQEAAKYYSKSAALGYRMAKSKIKNMKY